MASVVRESFALGSPPWPTVDPFLFCVHHRDAYPRGNPQCGPVADLRGRRIGQDFAGIDGWNMYHGVTVPGFPEHPHRGFETVSFVRQGLVDHSDSLGAAGRYGGGDVQWMTAGRGIQHAEMFPLVDPSRDNPMEMFQIWLNLPAEDKMVEPGYKMLWDHEIPRVGVEGEGEVTVVAGAVGDATAPAPAPSSWAARSDADVAIWHVRLGPGARLTLPGAAFDDTQRTLYVFDGDRIEIGEESFERGSGILVHSGAESTIVGGAGGAEFLVLQGRPIGEPVVSYGPFVMNTKAEIQQAFDDYNDTRFGGWPWERSDPVHGREPRRFARHSDGTEETAGG